MYIFVDLDTYVHIYTHTYNVIDTHTHIISTHLFMWRFILRNWCIWLWGAGECDVRRAGLGAGDPRKG